MDHPSIVSTSTVTSHTLFSHRMHVVDVLRGLIMVIMALDHVREYFGPTPFRAEDVSQTTVALFFTRWITHFCAPLFLFLSGVSAYLYNQKYDRRKTTVFLVTRGIWLILLELIVFSFILQWSYSMLLLGIIWAIGWSMVFLSLCLWFPRWLQLILAISIIVLHNLLPLINPVSSELLVPALLHNTPFVFMVGTTPVLSAYTIFPWASVMLLGYALGPLLQSPLAKGNRKWLYTGLVLMVAFVVIRGLNFYGDPGLWRGQERGPVYTLLSLLNLNKYPASFLFLLLTLAGGAILWYAFSRWNNRFTDFLQVYGRVPFFYFILHFSLISLASYIWTYLSFDKPYNLSFMSPADWPAAYHPSLTRVYLVWIAVVLVLYFPCKWFGNYKAKNRSWWVSYL